MEEQPPWWKETVLQTSMIFCQNNAAFSQPVTYKELGRKPSKECMFVESGEELSCLQSQAGQGVSRVTTLTIQPNAHVNRKRSQ